MIGNWKDLTPKGERAWLLALATLPDDRANPAPLCERVARILGMLADLCDCVELDDADRAIFRSWALDETVRAYAARLSEVLDLVAPLRRTQAITIHILRNHEAVCQLPGPPSKWPDGQIWVTEAEYLSTKEMIAYPAGDLRFMPYQLCPACDERMMEQTS